VSPHRRTAAHSPRPARPSSSRLPRGIRTDGHVARMDGGRAGTQRTPPRTIPVATVARVPQRRGTPPSTTPPLGRHDPLLPGWGDPTRGPQHAGPPGADMTDACPPPPPEPRPGLPDRPSSPTWPPTCSPRSTATSTPRRSWTATPAPCASTSRGGRGDWRAAGPRSRTTTTPTGERRAGPARPGHAARGRPAEPPAGRAPGSCSTVPPGGIEVLLGHMAARCGHAATQAPGRSPRAATAPTRTRWRGPARVRRGVGHARPSTATGGGVPRHGEVLQASGKYVRAWAAPATSTRPPRRATPST
jgi:hypothetical protein